MECLFALADEAEAVQDEDQDAFAALLELADQEDKQESCASQSAAVSRLGLHDKAAGVAREHAHGPYRPSSAVQTSQESKRSFSGEDASNPAVQRPQKRNRCSYGSKENDGNVSNTAGRARPQPGNKQSAAFTSALARDQRAQAMGRPAHQDVIRKPASAPTQEKFSGLRMKNPVFPSVVLQERLSMLHFLRLSRVSERAAAGEGGSQWATIGVLAEKFKSGQSSSGQAYSAWQISDLTGASLKLLLFGDAHQSHYRESEGSIMAICNARMSGQGGRCWKLQDASSIYKLGTSADYALCGAKIKGGGSCRNAVNASVCRFCDHHVQGEYKRLNSSRGPLMTATVAAQLGSRARAAAKKQARPQLPCYVPPESDMQHLDSSAATFASQGARHIAGVFSNNSAEAGRALAPQTQSQPGAAPGKPRVAPKTEPGAYQSQAAGPQAIGSRESGPATHRQAAPLPRPLRMQLDLPTRKQPRPLQSQAGSEPRTAQHQSAPGTMKPAGKPGGMQARIARQVGSLGPEASRAKTGAEALVLLEEDEAGWDAADLHSVQQKAKAVPQPDRGAEEEEHMPAVPQPVSPVRAAAAPASHPSNLPQMAKQAERAQALHKAAQIIQSRGGMKAMTAQQDASQRCTSGLAAARAAAAAASAAASTAAPAAPGSATPGLTPGAFFKAKPSQPTADTAKPMAAAPLGSRHRLTAQPGLASQSTRGKRPAAAAKHQAVVCKQGQSAFAAAFGDVLKDVDLQHTSTRYTAVIDDEEHERINSLLGSMQQRDEAQQRMASITHLTVTAWRCATCESTTDKRRPACQGHEGKSVTVTKRWWTCTGCNHRFSTLSVKYPKTRCPNPRCTAPESDFRKAGMAPSKVKSASLGGESAVASREDFQARGTEHSFCLK
ncbi:hypothetical protein CVIRNUC_002874 [Coccomyxa viridis]|uniref:Protein MCM10 homolog n=1 Tax=Coccomyxa viridis TaxID=1274662 RepID=A0AAV1I020_9CHLO|nr:hypothetical protein CVIRNUC_002874 [Coccomyxa viridis]